MVAMLEYRILFDPSSQTWDDTCVLFEVSIPVSDICPKGVPIREYKAQNNGPGVGIHREMMNDVVLIESILKDLRSVERLKDA